VGRQGFLLLQSKRQSQLTECSVKSTSCTWIKHGFLLEVTFCIPQRLFNVKFFFNRLNAEGTTNKTVDFWITLTSRFDIQNCYRKKLLNFYFFIYIQEDRNQGETQSSLPQQLLSSCNTTLRINQSILDINMSKVTKTLRFCHFLLQKWVGRIEVLVEKMLLTCWNKGKYFWFHRILKSKLIRARWSTL